MKKILAFDTATSFGAVCALTPDKRDRAARAGDLLEAVDRLVADPRTIEGLVAERSLAGDWPGSHLPYEGALLSMASSQRDLGLSRLRSAGDWMRAWVRRPSDGSGHGVSADDIAEVAWGQRRSSGAQIFAAREATQLSAP